MSEAAAAPSAPATSAASTASQAGGVNEGQGSKGPAASQSQAQGGKAQSPEGARSAPQNSEEEVEEIKIGSASAKLPKAIAKAVKDLERGFHAKAQESAQIRRQFEQFAKAAKDNPDMFFEQFGIDPDQYSQSRLAKKLELEMMDPATRKAMELEKKLKTYEEQEKQAKEQAEKEKLTRAEQEADRRLRSELMDAVKSSPLVADDPHMIARVAATMAAADEQGLNWTWEQCVARVDQEIRSALRSLGDRLDPEGIQDLLGEGALKKWREYDVKRVTGEAAKKTSAAASKQSPGSMASKQNGPKKAMSEAEYREYFEQLARG